ncbi:DUF6665 family protein [Anaeromyxobacter paludicola]|uniref:Uncharacterized protein n=1 Tax=Anaeromyxobacter paludicola TaxID=2918171 RepID=A0ABN6N8L0_9BACT|nr:DUF6665 family protein [Anaeromyxobacter paludicola]BDG09560.1 hypothetical protein AMPC_26730 [Anaeromyxobacter paludicola]
MASAEGQARVEHELVGERAGTLSRLVERLELALAELQEAGADREERLARAAELLWYVVVQREAVGISRHDVLYEVLRVPREVRLAMGPRRRGG